VLLSIDVQINSFDTKIIQKNTVKAEDLKQYDLAKYIIFH